MVERLGKLHELGVAGVSIAIDGKTRAEWWSNAERYAEVFDQFPAACTRHEPARSPVNAKDTSPAR